MPATFIVTLCDTTAGIGNNGSVEYVGMEGQTDVKSEMITYSDYEGHPKLLKSHFMK